MTETILPQIGQLYQTLAARLKAGAAFTTARAAWQGHELLGHITGWQISLTLTGKTLSLSAVNRSQARQLPPLAVAIRQGPGQYDVSLTRPAFESWLAPVLPEPELPHGYDSYIAQQRRQNRAILWMVAAEVRVLEVAQ